jgi:hypothetical protein
MTIVILHSNLNKCDIKNLLHKIFIREKSLSSTRTVIKPYRGLMFIFCIHNRSNFHALSVNSLQQKKARFYDNFSIDQARRRKYFSLTRFEEFLIMNGINFRAIDSESHFCSFVLYCASFAPLKLHKLFGIK